jgi:hypothetical protein
MGCILLSLHHTREEDAANGCIANLLVGSGEAQTARGIPAMQIGYCKRVSKARSGWAARGSYAQT